MKNYEDIIKALECCADAEGARCRECPYHEQCDCRQKDKDAIELIEEMKAKLEALEAPTAMPDYEVEYNRHSCENAKLHIQINEMREELIFLRAVKATAEAFLGREIR